MDNRLLLVKSEILPNNLQLKNNLNHPKDGLKILLKDIKSIKNIIQNEFKFINLLSFKFVFNKKFNIF